MTSEAFSVYARFALLNRIMCTIAVSKLEISYGYYLFSNRFLKDLLRNMLDSLLNTWQSHC